MMYSVRIYTRSHGNTQFYMLIGTFIVSAVFYWLYGKDYLIIYISSSLIHLLLEIILFVGKIRKGTVYVFGRKLPRVADIFLRALVDGPSVFVPSFFVADQIMSGHPWTGILIATLIMGLASLYMGITDRNGVRRLPENEAPLISRRTMTNPGAVMFLALINTVSLGALFLMPMPYRTHALIFVAAYSLLVMLFYLINYSLGARFVEIFDAKREAYVKPGPLFQAAALTYDSIYEMAFLFSPAYWVVFYLGLFEYAAIS